MATKKAQIAKKYKIWLEAKKKFRLSRKHIQMARELGLNPKKFGSLGNHKQQPWKSPLSEFIEDIYFKRFKKDNPDKIITIQELIKADKANQS